MLTTPIRRKEDIDAIKKYFLDKEDYRDYALFVIGINSALRISDIISIQWDKVYDFEQHRFRTHLTVCEQKTGKSACIAINKSCQKALCLLMKQKQHMQDDYIFYSGDDTKKHISRNRAWHIIKKAAVENGLDGNISCHSLRKTFGYHAW